MHTTRRKLLQWSAGVLANTALARLAFAGKKAEIQGSPQPEPQPIEDKVMHVPWPHSWGERTIHAESVSCHYLVERMCHIHVVKVRYPNTDFIRDWQTQMGNWGTVNVIMNCPVPIVLRAYCLVGIEVESSFDYPQWFTVSLSFLPMVTGLPTPTPLFPEGVFSTKSYDGHPTLSGRDHEMQRGLALPE